MTDTETDQYAGVDTSDLAATLRELRQAKENIEAEIELIRPVLSERLRELGGEHIFEYEGTKYTVSVSDTKRRDVNLDRLREIDPDLWADVTKRVFDPKAYDAVWAQGRISPETATEVVRTTATEVIRIKESSREQ